MGRLAVLFSRGWAKIRGVWIFRLRTRSQASKTEQNVYSAPGSNGLEAKPTIPPIEPIESEESDVAEDENERQGIHYRPLNSDSREIRLLHVLPIGPNGELRLKLKRCSLKQSPAFIALSYVWGDASVGRDINISGAVVSVTVNLAEALQHISYDIDFLLKIHNYVSKIHKLPLDTERGVYLWVDALCIHQTDMRERNQQIQLMKSIYTQASFVLSWLGPAPKSSRVFRALQVMSRKITSSLGQLQPYDDTWLNIYPEFCRKDYDPNEDNKGPAMSNHIWDEIATLAANPYWTRTWILQEIALAQSLCFMYGGVFLFEMHLREFQSWVGRRQEGTQLTKPQKMDPDVWNSITSKIKLDLGVLRTVLGLRSSIRSPNYNAGLDPVSQTIGWKSSDPRDRIYGLLALCETDIVADYNRPARDVYCEFTEKWFSQVHSLVPLCYAGIGRTDIPKHTFELPSWVADWNGGSFKHGTYLCRAGGFPWKTPSSITVEHDILKIRAFCVDSIERVEALSLENIASFFVQYGKKGSDALYPTEMPHLQAVMRLFSWELETESFGVIDVSYEYIPIFLHFLITCTSNTAWQSLPADAFSEETTQFFASLNVRTDENFGADMHERFLQRFFGNVYLNWHGQTAQEVLFDSMDAKAIYRRSELELRMNLDLRTRRVFHTKSGYIGTGYPGIQPGDRVMVVPGFDFPILLRPTGAHYRHVGVCYIVGIADGEALRGMENDWSKSQVVEIH